MVANSSGNLTLPDLDAMLENGETLGYKKYSPRPLEDAEKDVIKAWAQRRMESETEKFGGGPK